jgi:hypothetical protein
MTTAGSGSGGGGGGSPFNMPVDKGFETAPEPAAPAPAKTGMSLFAKIAIGAGVAGILYVATRKRPQGGGK